MCISVAVRRKLGVVNQNVVKHGISKSVYIRHSELLIEKRVSGQEKRHT